MSLSGTDTVATTLEWLILYLCHYPREQEKVYRDLLRAVGPGRTPTLGDKADALYFGAFVEEVFRHCPQGAVPIPHAAMEDMEVGGVKIPKGTQVKIE